MFDSNNRVILAATASLWQNFIFPHTPCLLNKDELDLLLPSHSSIANLIRVVF